MDDEGIHSGNVHKVVEQGRVPLLCFMQDVVITSRVSDMPTPLMCLKNKTQYRENVEM